MTRISDERLADVRAQSVRGASLEAICDDLIDARATIVEQAAEIERLRAHAEHMSKLATPREYSDERLKRMTQERDAAIRERDRAQTALRNLHIAGDTLSPQEIINHCAIGLGTDISKGYPAYAGDPQYRHKSVIEQTTALRAALAEVDALQRTVSEHAAVITAFRDTVTTYMMSKPITDTIDDDREAAHGDAHDALCDLLAGDAAAIADAHDAQVREPLREICRELSGHPSWTITHTWLNDILHPYGLTVAALAATQPPDTGAPVPLADVASAGREPLTRTQMLEVAWNAADALRVERHRASGRGGAKSHPIAWADAEASQREHFYRIVDALSERGAK